jgi:tetratricopeptide (TPR) repeat protein
MRQKMPVIRQIAWNAVAVQVVVTILLAAAIRFAFAVKDFMFCIFLGALTYLIYSRIARAFFAREHIAGIRDYQAQRFGDALAHFEASYDFFSRHPGIDRMRYIVLGTASANSYQAIALCNIAFCQTQLGEGQAAKRSYERALREFPECVLARTSLTMLRSTEAKANSQNPPK